MKRYMLNIRGCHECPNFGRREMIPLPLKQTAEACAENDKLKEKLDDVEDRKYCIAYRSDVEMCNPVLKLTEELEEKSSRLIDIGIELLYATKEAEKLKQLVGTILLECLVYSGTPEFDKIVRLIKETVLAK